MMDLVAQKHPRTLKQDQSATYSKDLQTFFNEWS